MEGLLERLARLSLKKAGNLSRTGGSVGGAALGNMLAPGVGGYLGGQAGQALGGGVESALGALSESGQGPRNMQVGNLGSYQQQPSFGQRFAGNFGEQLGNQAGNALGQAMQGGEENVPQEEQSVASQLEALLDSLSPEERNSILAKYTGGM